ncbi:MAG: DMT family transporter [Thermodesulfobacteriaceae bacterium]|nr:DMT family transporter [Thermodesulfobacteriaceae bacterium]
MEWIFFSILAGFFVALSDALNKKYWGREGYVKMALARTLGSLPFLLHLFLYLTFYEKKFIYLSLDFLENTAILLGLEILATLFYMRAIEISALSKSLPFLSFTPIFIVFTGYILLGERITIVGLLGIILIITGAYLINLQKIREGFLAPFRGIWEERGSLFILVTAFIYGITSVLGKRGIIMSDPLYFAGFYFSVLSFFTPLVLKMVYRIKIWEVVSKNLKGLVLVGGTQALMCVSHMIALSLVETAYMIALKRTSILFAVVLGGLIFKEQQIPLRFSAAFIMFLGILIIALWK